MYDFRENFLRIPVKFHVLIKTYKKQFPLYDSSCASNYIAILSDKRLQKVLRKFFPTLYVLILKHNNIEINS